jgi:PAS domain S-box-containing protein
MALDSVKLLIVDDEPRNLDALEVMLTGSGCTFVRASSPDDALLAMLQHDFAAMVLDIRMPGMSGIELAKLVKQRKRTRDVPILFLTAHMMDDDDVLKGYGAGAVDYLSKPVNADILRSKIAVFVDLYTKTRELGILNDALNEEVAQRRQAQEALELANRDLERRVRERTAALTVAHTVARESEERLRLAIEVARSAAWEWNLASGQVSWSADPEVLFGFPPGTLDAGKRLTPVVHPDDRANVLDAIDRAIGGHVYECEYRAVRPNGSIVWITERGRVFQDEEGVNVKMVGISRDVSLERESQMDRERLLVSERRARHEAEQQSRIKDEFLATLSHELRTPMNAILGWLSLLVDGKVEDPARALAIIERNAKAQAHLIEDLLLMNKLTSGMAQLELGRVNMAMAIEAAVQNLLPAARGKGVAIDVSVDGRLPAIRADAHRVQQILWNLLHNGVKFTPNGGYVRVGAEPNGATVRVEISDNGQGIAPDFLPHVFERFRQADASTTRRAWGLGLGLSIAKHLVELHGGTIAVYSEGLGQGSRFTVDLPIVAEDASAPTTTDHTANVQQTSEESAPDPVGTDSSSLSQGA